MGLRTPLLAGNWKMHKTRREAADFLKQLEERRFANENGLETVICAPFTALDVLGPGLSRLGIRLGAQNVHWDAEGAYTGEISAGMLAELGVSYVIVGHSERRQHFGETDKHISWKLKTLLERGLTPILCVGESMETHQSNQTQSHLRRQLTAATEGLSAVQAEKLVVAYEPLWAIGTGKTPQPEEAGVTIGWIRAVMADRFGQRTADRMRMLYGGSVTPENIAAMTGRQEVDGVLVGGASLDPDTWIKLCQQMRIRQR